MSRKIFISYHHQNDQYWANRLGEILESQGYTDRSLGERIDSSDDAYIYRRIREGYIRGSSVTIVLLGSETSERKWIDWETHATLDMKHGLLAVRLPTWNREYPDRLEEDIKNGHSIVIGWEELNSLPSYIERAAGRPEYLIENSNNMRRRNR